LEGNFAGKIFWGKIGGSGNFVEKFLAGKTARKFLGAKNVGEKFFKMGREKSPKNRGGKIWEFLKKFFWGKFEQENLEKFRGKFWREKFLGKSWAEISEKIFCAKNLKKICEDFLRDFFWWKN